MPATVHFATNRVLDGPPDQLASYSESVVAPSNPNEVTYGTAFVNDANLTADTIGAITSIQTIGKGQFDQGVIGDLSDRGQAQSVGKQLQRVVREDTRIAAMAERVEINER